MNYLDFIGTVLSLIGTYYFVKADIRMWLVYILATIVNSILYFKYTMYASMILEIGYLVMSVYGFASWHIAAKQSNDYIRSLSYKQYPKFIIIWLVIIVIIYGILITFSDSTMPKLETIAVSTSIIALLLSTKKKVNSWYGWIVADSIYIYLMASQKLYFHMFLFSCYLISAIIGLKNWQRLKNIADENLIEQTT